MSGGVAQVTGAIPSPRAVTACAHKLARLIYTMVTKGEEYVDQGEARSTRSATGRRSSDHCPGKPRNSASNSSPCPKRPKKGLMNQVVGSVS